MIDMESSDSILSQIEIWLNPREVLVGLQTASHSVQSAANRNGPSKRRSPRIDPDVFLRVVVAELCRRWDLFARGLAGEEES